MFQWVNNLYQQRFGTAIGTPLAPPYNNDWWGLWISPLNIINYLNVRMLVDDMQIAKSLPTNQIHGTNLIVSSFHATMILKVGILLLRDDIFVEPKIWFAEAKITFLDSDGMRKIQTDLQTPSSSISYQDTFFRHCKASVLSNSQDLLQGGGQTEVKKYLS